MLRSDANDPGSSTPPVAGQLFLSKPTILYHHGKLIVQTRRASDSKTRPCSNRGPIKRAGGNQSASERLGRGDSSAAACRQSEGAAHWRELAFPPIAHPCCIQRRLVELLGFELQHPTFSGISSSVSRVCELAPKVRQGRCNSCVLLLLRQLEQEFRVPPIPPLVDVESLVGGHVWGRVF